MKKGGYIIIDLQSASIVNDLAKALDSNKPVLVYDANNDANFYTLSYDGDSEVYTLTGAKDIISVDGNGAVTTTGTQLHLYQIKIGDLYSTLYSYIDIKDVNITYNATELTDDEKESLTAIKDLVKDAVYLSSSAEDTSFIPLNCDLLVSGKFIIQFTYLSTSDMSDTTFDFKFTITDGKVSDIASATSTDDLVITKIF